MLRLALLVLALLAAAAPAAAARKPLKSVKLPKGFKPEGIAKGWGNYYYVGGLTGRISRVDVTTGVLTEIVSLSDVSLDSTTAKTPIPSGIITGMKVDPNTRLLFAAGGLTGGAWVIQLDAEGLVDTNAATPYQFVELNTKTAALINDVAVRTVKQGSAFATLAYLTDSIRSSIYKISGCPAKCVVSGPYSHPLLRPSPGPSTIALNGIIAAPLPAGNFIVGDSLQGKLFKVTIATSKKVTVVPVKLTTSRGAPIAKFVTDGLLSVGKKIFAVEASSVTELKFNAAYTSAKVVARISDKLFAGVTTIAAGPSGPMYAVNARFAQCPGPTSCPKVAFQLIMVEGAKY